MVLLTPNAAMAADLRLKIDLLSSIPPAEDDEVSGRLEGIQFAELTDQDLRGIEGGQQVSRLVQPQVSVERVASRAKALTLEILHLHAWQPFTEQLGKRAPFHALERARSSLTMVGEDDHLVGLT